MEGPIHTAENGPSGFKSKHLNFFCGIYLSAVHRVIISIFRKCHLGNFEQINFKETIKSAFTGLKLDENIVSRL